jgi:hypothetical protein
MSTYMPTDMPTDINPISQKINTPFSSSYSNFSLQETQSIKTPSMPYNYMPRPNTENTKSITHNNIVRPNYTTSPDELPAYDEYSLKYSVFSNENYQKPVNDKIMQSRVIDLLNPNTSGTSFVPSPSPSSIIG